MNNHNIRNMITEIINDISRDNRVPPETFIQVMVNTPAILNNINILDQSFREQEDITKPMCHDFKSKLERITINQANIEDELSCSVCQERFKLGENAIILPCKEQKHYFHADNTEDCNGIMPWFEENNTCPVCRCEYPVQKDTESTEEQINSLPVPESLIGSNNTELTEGQRQGLRMGNGNIPQPYEPQRLNVNIIDNEENIPEGTIPEENIPEGTITEGTIPEGTIPRRITDQERATDRGDVLNRSINHDINDIIHLMRRTMVNETYNEEELMQRAIMRSIEDQ